MTRLVYSQNEKRLPLQGRILSPALFSIKINSIIKAVLKGTDCSLFVDNFVHAQQDIEQSGKGYVAVC